MFNDSEITNWLNQYGVVTSFNFIAYGSLSDDDKDLLIKGLVVRLTPIVEKGKMAVLYDDIDEEKAVATNTFQGTSLNFLFAGEIDEQTSLIIENTILEGLTYLRYKGDFLGANRSVSNV